MMTRRPLSSRVSLNLILGSVDGACCANAAAANANVASSFMETPGGNPNSTRWRALVTQCLKQESNHMQIGLRYAIAAGSLLALIATSIPGIGADAVPAKPARANYELAARWTPAKVGKIIFDTAVTPHWMDSGDRFWYSFENTSGRKFYIVDPAKKTKTQVYDPAKLAAALTTATGLPYDSQHLPITVIRFVKNEGSIQFEVSVPRDAAIPGEKKPPATSATTDAG